MKYKIVLFDGVCHLCDRTVRFIVKRDKRNHFKFATFQSENGKLLVEKFQINYVKDLTSVVLIDEGEVYYKSTAILRIFRYIPLWKAVCCFAIIPRSLRDKLYNIIGNNRYRWFGKYDSCLVPDKELLDRFDLSDIVSR